MSRMIPWNRSGKNFAASSVSTLPAKLELGVDSMPAEDVGYFRRVCINWFVNYAPSCKSSTQRSEH